MKPRLHHLLLLVSLCVPALAQGTKISELPSLSGASVANDDVLPIVDTSAGTAGSKKITWAELVNGLGLSAKAPLVSPAFTGTPTAPTATAGTATTQIATTAFAGTAATNAAALPANLVTAATAADATQVAAVQDELVEETWVVEGDSWSAGTAQGNDRETWPFYLGQLRSRSVSIINVAQNGTTAQTMAGTFAASVAPHLTATTGRPSTAFIFAGINDAGGRTTTQLRDDLRSMWTAARSGGARVVAFTLPDRTAVGGWSATDWASINAQIIADSSYYDVLVRTDIVFGRIAAETSDNLHVTTAAHAKFAGRILDAMHGRQVLPSLVPDSVCNAVAGTTFAAGTRKNLGFTVLYQNNSDMTSATVGGDAGTTVFTAPCPGTYEIVGGVLAGGLTAGDTIYLSAWITPAATGVEAEHRLKWLTASGANGGLDGTIRRRLLRGDQVNLAAVCSRAGATLLTNPNFSVFAVRLVSIP